MSGRQIEAPWRPWAAVDQVTDLHHDQVGRKNRLLITVGTDVKEGPPQLVRMAAHITDDNDPGHGSALPITHS